MRVALESVGAGDQRLYLLRKRGLVVARQANQILRAMTPGISLLGQDDPADPRAEVVRGVQGELSAERVAHQCRPGQALFPNVTRDLLREALQKVGR